MAYQLSPDVIDNEVDLTGIVPGVGTTEGAFAGDFVWGPFESIVQVANENDIVSRFGKPTQNTFTSFFTAANFLSYARNLKMIRSTSNSTTAVANTSSGDLTIKNEDHYTSDYYNGSGTWGEWAARYPGSLGNSLTVSSCPSGAAFNAQHSLKANTVAGSANINFTGIVSGDATRVPSVGDYITVGTETEKRVVAVAGSVVTVNTALTSNQSLVNVSSRWAYSDAFDDAPGTSDWAAARGGSNDEMHIIVIDTDGKFTGFPGTVLEKYAFVSKASDAQASTGITNFYVDVIKERSNYVYWMDHQTGGNNWGSSSVGTSFDAVSETLTRKLSGAVDAVSTTGQVMLAYDKFQSEEVDISLIMTGDHNAVISSHVINNIAEVRRDCVVFVSPPRAAVVNNVGDERNDILSHRFNLPSSSYAFMTDNWKYQFDKYNNTFRWIPDNGDIAGIAARSDFDTDPWFSFAGLNRGQVKNVAKLAWLSNKSDRDELYKKGINSVVTFTGEGTVLWGDKTLLSKPSAFDRINVRRLFIVLRKAIKRAARYSLFEFNDRFTRAQFVSMVEPFLRDVQGRRGIFDFRVVCNETNNTPTVIDRNEFIGDIYVKPARSINFITLNFVAINTGVAFEEVLGQF